MNIAHAQDQAVKVGVNLNAFDAIMSASLVVKLTLFILVSLSVLSWAIVWAKKKQFEAIHSSDERFLRFFWNAKSWDEVFAQLNEHISSPCANVFKAGFKELRKVAESLATEKDDKPKRPQLAGSDNLARAMRKASDLEIAQVENRLNILATTGSTAPFIGLFGTVWGIMGAFQKIGATGAAHLAVVAPGISEALIATAIGLFVAIPAVIAYNHYVGQLKKVEIELNNFSSDFLNIAKRNFFKGE